MSSSATNIYSVPKPIIYRRFVPFPRYRISRNPIKYLTCSIPPCQSLNIHYPRQRLVKTIGKRRIVRQNIKKPNPSLIFIHTTVNGSRLRAMIDTGATHLFITQCTLSTLYHSAVPSCDRLAQLGDGHTILKILGEVQLLLQFDSFYAFKCSRHQNCKYRFYAWQ